MPVTLLEPDEILDPRTSYSRLQVGTTEKLVLAPAWLVRENFEEGDSRIIALDKDLLKAFW